MLVKRLRFSVALFAIGLTFSAAAQTNLGESCGCPPVASRFGPVNLSTKADGLGNLIATNTILSCDTIYKLNDKIYVGDGKIITIAPGTLIKAPSVPSDANALIVSRGGKIMAPGTQECPIVFTADADPMNGTYGIENRGKWGGVVILGKAANNLKGGFGLNTISDGIGFIEGFTSGEPRNEYGAAPGLEDNNDNSGIMTYVSIRHSGEIVGAANELNGLSLGSVGRGTTLSHIEIVSSLDDGIEFFGGTVDVKYASVLFNDDDGFDWDQGWAGRGQFWVVVKTDLTTSPGGDNGFENDSDDALQCRYHANPKIYNCTYIGAAGINIPGPGTALDNNQAIEWKEASRGEIRNCIFSNYSRGVQFANTAFGTHKIDADGTGPGAPVDVDDCYGAWNAGTLKLENCTFIGAVDPVRVGGAVGSGADLTKFAADGNTSVPSIAGFAGFHNMVVSNNSVTTKHDIIPGANVTPVSAPPVNGFYTPVTYRGAFETGKKSWLSDYTLNALIGLEANLGTCVTDINTDGTTNTSDFLLLLGAFGTNCN
jgi:hypothetical protein